MAANQDDELAAIRAQRLQQMQDQLQEQAMQQMQAEEVAHAEAQSAAQIDAILRQALSSDARARITRISMVEPQRAQALKETLALMHQNGQLNTPMDDASLKQWLVSQSKSRSNASIRRI
ncbi:MAG: hypothetical protein ISP83_00365 [Candidatus Poseidonia sp.]|nr:hypothetical protein [Poseidonia sp.]MBL6748574.1 hypothetical protein [Poseidonia sp.]MBL6805940.1 hypothetical protein [Poseidonia sp.]MBL6886825.1 hypothetical protein [Poseidonia sp.]MBL6892020.1 hypothetical protein [Poseidonia sp.]